MTPQIQYELQPLELLFSDYLARGEGNHHPPVPEFIASETERVKKSLVHEVFHFEDERHLERYIQYHQQALIRLMDKAASLLPAENTTSHIHLYYKGLEEILVFIERHFTKYFDQDAKAPESYIAIARKDAKANLRKIQKYLNTLHADPRLVDLLLHPLRRILKDNPHKDTTYRKVLYAKEMQKELLRLPELNPPAIDDELRQIIYYLNYNAAKTFAYFAHYISSLINQSETRTEKIEQLSFTLKTINQAQIKPGIHYNLHAHSLRDQLNEYITVEIDYLERLQSLSGNSPSKPLDSFLQSFKLKFDISVAQLACLLRIFIDTKIIQNSNVAEILRFAARFIITKRAEVVSFDSLRAKYYNIESGTRQSVRTLLTSMIQKLDRY